MNTNQDAVDKYRKQHKRCKTCVHASNGSCSWYCKAKQSRHFGDLYDTKIAGAFCKLYTPKSFS